MTLTSTQIVLHSNPACDNVLSHHVWVQKGHKLYNMELKKTIFCQGVNPHCQLDTDISIPIFLHDIQAHEKNSTYKVWLQMVKQFRWHRQNMWWSFRNNSNPQCDSDLEDSNPDFLSATPAYNNVLSPLPYNEVSLQNLEAKSSIVRRIWNKTFISGADLFLWLSNLFARHYGL